MDARKQPQDALTSALKTAAFTGAAVGVIVLGSWLDAADSEIEITQALAVEAARAQAQMAERERVHAELVPQVRAAYQQGLDEGAERERERARALAWQEAQR